MTLLTVESVDLLAERVLEFSLQQREHDLFEALQTEMSSVEKPTAEVTAVAHLLSATALGDGVKVDLSALKKCQAEVRGHLKNWNPRELKDSGALKRLRSELDKVQIHLRGEAQRRWREHLDANPIPRIGDLAELFNRLGIEETLVLSIRNSLRRLEKSAELPYPSVDEFEKYDEDLAKVNEGANRIGLEGSWPPSVTSFFQQAAEHGAPLDLLTDEVIEWLDEHHYAGYFRIIPISTD